MKSVARKHLTIITEAFEFQRIPAWVEQEQCRLLADFARETDAGLDHETHIERAQTRSERLPRTPFQDETEVAHRHALSVDLVAQRRVAFFRPQVRGELVAVEIEIHPPLRAPALGAAEDIAVEMARRDEIVDGEGQMEAGIVGHRLIYEESCLLPGWQESKLKYGAARKISGNRDMNVFILCTGRCGSTTFIEACRHISNFSAAHESRTHLLGSDRLDYPSDHIEADNRLSWLLGRLDRKFGREAFYVHLTRDTQKTAASYVKRYHRRIMKAYRGGGIIMGLSEEADPMAVALDYCDTVNSNIEAFLKDKPQQMHFLLEQAKRDFPVFCERIGAEVDLPRALAEFDVLHNSEEKRGRRPGLMRLMQRR